MIDLEFKKCIINKYGLTLINTDLITGIGSSSSRALRIPNEAELVKMITRSIEGTGFFPTETQKSDNYEIIEVKSKSDQNRTRVFESINESIYNFTSDEVSLEYLSFVINICK